MEMARNLPEGLCPLETQVAGHMFDGLLINCGVLTDALGVSVLKPLTKQLYAEREISFYNKTETEDSIIFQVKNFVPKYEGDIKIPICGKQQQFIKLENLTHSMEKPCVMDIKIGLRTWDPLATPDKIMAEKQKYAACKQAIGLCIPGFQIYDQNGECLKFGKEYGRSLNQNTFISTLIRFLSVKNKCYKPLIKSILNQLYLMQKWFSFQTSLNFFSSSILIAYDSEILINKFHLIEEGSLGASTEHRGIKSENINEDNIPWIKVKMIDFAHVFDAESKVHDVNYLFGLQNLIWILQSILIENC